MKATPFIICFLVLAFASTDTLAQDSSIYDWPIHDLDRPAPRQVEPGVCSATDEAVPPPADAVVLFSKDDLSAWQHADSSDVKWMVDGDVFQVVKGTGYIDTKQKFGSVQAHVEFMSPVQPDRTSQNKGNSGFFFFDRTYEVQILNSYDNPTYPDGQAAALYGQTPPLVNASCPEMTWQKYDIVFNRPKFDALGNVSTPASTTVFHNGILVQNHTLLAGPTSHKKRTPYEVHEAKGSISLQDHGEPVRFRNVWVRELD